MSKGHLEALRAMREGRLTVPVTKQNVTLATVTKVTKPALRSTGDAVKIGRPKLHASPAAKQKAYRDRKKAST